MELIHKIRQTIQEEGMLERGDRILCAVSGGADSTAMLLLLHTLAPGMGLSLEAAHLNHCLRGADSDRDELFVQSLCERLEIPFHCRRIDVAEEAEKTGQGIEACAREIRYSFFRDVMEECGIKVLATAHTARDNLETALFHLTRGTGVAGLAGIPAVRSSGSIRIIRPLISASREEIEIWLRKHGETYVTDSTNESDAYTRNYIRRHILPELEKLNPSLYDTAAATQRRLREDADFIRQAVEAAYEDCVENDTLDVRILSELHPAVSGRLIVRLYREIAPDGSQLTGANCDAVLALARSSSPSARMDLPSGVSVRREYGKLRFMRGENAVSELRTRMLKIGGSTFLEEAGLEIICGIESDFPQNFRVIHKFFFDYSHIYGILSVRARREGDSIRLTGHDHTKTLKKAMIDAKIPRYRRGLVPVICDERGIAAVDGLGVDERVAVTPETRQVLCVQIIQIDGGNRYGDSIR